MRLEKFFDEAARARVAEAVKAAEARTSGQIVPVVVERSGNYHVFLQPLSVTFGVTLFSLGLALFVPALNLTPLNVLVGAMVVVGLQIALGFIPAYARLIGAQQFEVAARQRAMVAFVEHGVYRTREENGVLLFASIDERKVVVLGDRAVHEKLGDEHWKRAVESLVAGIKSGDAAGGFCTAIVDIGEEMSRAFPRGDEPPPNELSDELQIDR